MDREGLADFLRRRREALRPEDVGLSQGRRRRTAGLRREEVALLAHMSTDFYARLEQQRGSRPSAETVAALAAALRLKRAERDPTGARLVEVVAREAAAQSPPLAGQAVAQR